MVILGIIFVMLCLIVLPTLTAFTVVDISYKIIKKISKKKKEFIKN